jgi:hypothetical protein
MTTANCRQQATTTLLHTKVTSTAIFGIKKMQRTDAFSQSTDLRCHRHIKETLYVSLALPDKANNLSIADTVL